MDETLRELELFHAILDHSHDSIVIADGQQLIRYWSRSAERLFGYGREEAIGSTLIDLLIPVASQSETRSRFEQLAACRSSQGIPQVIEMEAKQKQGGKIFVALTLTTVRMEQEGWAIAIIRNDTARRRREEDLVKQASTDPLSGLDNRAAFQRKLESNLDQPIALAIIDLDGFKQVNDQLGHLAGDSAIEQAAARLNTHFQEAVCCARLGGDEFGVILLAERDEVLQLFERLRAELEEATRDESVPVTVSVGVTFQRPGDTARDLLARADALLYQSKESGRNRVSAD